MLTWCSAHLPQGILQSAGQRGKTLPAKNNFGIFPAGENQGEVINPVREWLTRDSDVQIIGLEEIRHPLPARRMCLAEDDVPIRAMFCAPGTHTPFQRATRLAQITVRVPEL